MTRVSLVLAMGIALVLSWSSGAAEDFKVDDEGFIRNWLLLGPIALDDGQSGADGIDKEWVKGEAKLEPKEGEKVKVGNKEIAWKKIKATDYYFDINELLGDRFENVCAYAVTYVVADEEMKVNLLMSSNDQGKTFVNGKEVIKFTETRSIEKDQDTAKDVTLVKGVNVIVHNIVNEQNNWQGAVRFTDKAGKPVKNVKIHLEK